MPSPQQFVSLVPTGGTPVHLADAKGRPFPTTGYGALVFNRYPTIYGANLIDPIIGGGTISPLTVENMALLSLVSATPAIAFVEGFYASGDGGGGIFFWDEDATDTPVPGMIVVVSGFATGRYLRLYSGSLYVTWFGAKGDEVADDAPAFNTAIEFIQDTIGEGTLVAPPGNYKLLTEIILDSDDLTLIVETGATLLQYTYGYSAVQIVDASRCSVKGGGRIVNPIAKTEIVGGNYNGNPARTRCSGVYMYGANRCLVSGVKIYNFVFGVNFYQLEDDCLTDWCAGNQIDGVYLEHFDFGFNGSNQRDLIISNCTGYYTDRSQGNVIDDDNGPAPHFIYISGKPGQNLPNQSVTIANCSDFLNGYSSSFKAKNTDGIVFMGCQSELAVRGYDLDVQNGRITTTIVRNVLGQVGLNCNATCSDVEFVAPLVYIEPDLSEYAALLAPFTLDPIETCKSFLTEETCSNITVRGGKFSHSHTGNNSQIQIAGRNIQIIDTEIEERDFNAFPVKIKASALNCQIIRPKVRQNATQALTGASWAAGTVTFTVASDTGLGETSYFVVSEVTPDEYNGTYEAIAGTTGTSILAALADDPGTYTSGGTLVGSLATGTRMVDVATGAKSTVIEVDPLVLNFTYANSSVSNAGTGTVLRRVDGSINGTWTPVPTFATPDNFAPTITTASGWYLRQGEWVTVGFILTFTCNAYSGSVAGDFRIGGLPFQAITPTSGGWSFVSGVGQFRNIAGTIDSMGISVATSDALFATLRRSVSAGTGANIDVTNIPAGTADVRIQAQITYRAAAAP